MSRIGLRFVALGYLTVILVGPLAMVFWRTFEDGFGPAWDALTSPETIHAFKLTLIITAIAVPVNTVFGIVCAIAIVRRKFPGKWLLNAFIDLPLALSPVVVGLSLFLLYGRDGWFGSWLSDHGIDVLFALPAMVIATIFVSLPFVAREVVPTLREVGDEQEQAARTLGAGGWQTFWRITLPSIRWAVVYGVILTTARCLGEYGAVAVVSGRIQGETETATLRVQERYESFDLAGAYAISIVLALLGDRRARCPDGDPTARRARRLMSITVRNITKRFGDFVAVDDISLEVESGALTALLGPSGSGKSTLLRIIAGLETPDAGEILLSGKAATALPPQKRNVGFVFQHYAAFKHMTVRDNIAFGLKVRRRPRAEIRERVDELLHLVQLQGFGDRYPAQLSGGQRQRMGLARALAPEPQVLLLDEPFGALDARVRAELRQWLRQLHDVVHVTTVFVTHDQEEAMEISDTIAVINHGALEQVGAPQELYDAPATEFVMRFVGDANVVGGALVWSDDLELLDEPADGSVEAMIVRVTVLGRDVKVELHDVDGAEIVAVIARRRFDELGLWRGQTVWVRARRERVFAGGR